MLAGSMLSGSMLAGSMSAGLMLAGSTLAGSMSSRSPLMLPRLTSLGTLSPVLMSLMLMSPGSLLPGV